MDKPPRTESHIPAYTTGNLPHEQDDEKKESDYADELEFNRDPRYYKQALTLKWSLANRASLHFNVAPEPHDSCIHPDLGNTEYNGNALIPGSEPTPLDPRD